MASNVQVGDLVKWDPFVTTAGTLIDRLNVVRRKHYLATNNSVLADEFPNDPTFEKGKTVKADTPTLLKKYLTTLENSKYITNKPGSSLPAMNVGDLLQIEKFRLIEAAVESVESDCTHNQGNYSGYNANSSNFSNFNSDFSNFSNFLGDFSGYNTDSSNFSGHNPHSTFYSGHAEYTNDGFCNPYTGCY